MLLTALKSKVPAHLLAEEQSCRRIELYRFIIDILRATFTSSNESSCLRETMFLRDVFVDEPEKRYSLLLTGDVSPFMHAPQLVAASELIFKNELNLTLDNVCVLFNLVLSVISHQRTAANFTAIDTERTTFVLAFCLQKYAEGVCQNGSKNSSGLDSDDDSDQDKESTSVRCFSVSL